MYVLYVLCVYVYRSVTPNDEVPLELSGIIWTLLPLCLFVGANGCMNPPLITCTLIHFDHFQNEASSSCLHMRMSLLMRLMMGLLMVVIHVLRTVCTVCVVYSSCVLLDLLVSNE